MLNRLNALLARLPRRDITIIGRRVPSWRVWSAIAAAAGVSTFLLLMRSEGISLLIAGLVGAVNFGVYQSLNRLTRHRIGVTRMTMLEHWLVDLGLTALIFLIFSVPLAAGLDAWILSLALTLGIGRVGCLFGGCCHGRVSAIGVFYPWRLWQQAPHFLKEVRLLPIPAYESLLLFTIFGCGLMRLYGSAEVGDALILFMLCYGSGRFCLEFYRGDYRFYFRGLSESQWISIGLVVSAEVLLLLRAGPLSLFWLILGAIAPVVILFFIWLTKSWSGAPVISPLSKRDVMEFTEKAKELRQKVLLDFWQDNIPSVSHSVQTARGIKINLRASRKDTSLTEHYIFTGPKRNLDTGTLSFVTLLIRRIVACRVSEAMNCSDGIQVKRR